MTLQFGKKILLTGAGFSADYGGYLLTEMWSKIFNNQSLASFPNLRKTLRDNYNFEFVHWLVNKDKKYTEDERKALQRAVVEAYQQMNDNIFSNRRNIQLGKLFDVFRGDAKKTVAHFTLNQDLLLEQGFSRMSLGLRIPEYKNYIDEVNEKAQKINEIKLPNEALLQKIKEKYMPSNGSEAYIKLHGSTGWLSSNGANAIVIGHEKNKGISSEPLLNWYSELFREALNAGEVKVLIIGYSFHDPHINFELSQAAANSGLKVYIVSPAEPLTIKATVNGHGHLEGKSFDCRAIWEALEGYYPYKLGELFPFDGSTPNAQNDLLKIFR